MEITKILQILAYSVTVLAGIGTIIGIIVAWRKRWFQQLKPFSKMANTVNIFMAEMLPSILEKFESKDLCPDGTLVKWVTLISKDKISISSPKILNEKGKKILEESGIKEIIDNNKSELIKKLKDKKIKNLLDIEKQSFYVLKSLEKREVFVPIKNYLYNNPDSYIEAILFVGSIYLRDKYFKEHPTLLNKM